MAIVTRRDRGTDGIYSAACPCCACTVVELSRSNGHTLAPLVWVCTFCGFSLMGLPVPARPRGFMGRWMTCLEVRRETDVAWRARGCLREVGT